MILPFSVLGLQKVADNDEKGLQKVADNDENGIYYYEKKLMDSSNYFIKNQGQINDSKIKFISSGGNVVFTPKGLLIIVNEYIPIKNDISINNGLSNNIPFIKPNLYREKGEIIEFSFYNSNLVEPKGQKKCSWDTNYFIGNDPNNWQTEVPNYFEIIYPSVWDGIDIVYKMKNGDIKYDFIVYPGGNPNNIQIQIDGHKSHYIDNKNDLVIKTSYMDIIDSGLFAYQGDQEEIKCEFEFIENNKFGFSVSEYDKSEILVIDPLVSYSTFLGQDGQDRLLKRSLYGNAVDLVRYPILSSHD